MSVFGGRKSVFGSSNTPSASDPQPGAGVAEATAMAGPPTTAAIFGGGNSLFSTSTSLPPGTPASRSRSAPATSDSFKGGGRGRPVTSSISFLTNASSSSLGSSAEIDAELWGNSGAYSSALTLDGTSGSGLKVSASASKAVTVTKARDSTLSSNQSLKQIKSARTERFSTGPQANRYMELREGREDLRQGYIRAGKMTDPDAKVSLDCAINMIGECADMCPEFERHEREFQKGLDQFEKIPGTDQVDHARAVKRYKRSAAGDPEPMPSDVRPPRVLMTTLDYLLHDLVREKGIIETYSFVRDRCRSVRNDFTLQNSRGLEAVECHERIARYHIVCAYLFATSKHNSEKSYFQEIEQMRKTLQSLREFYQDLAKQGIYCPNEAEFQAYYILAHFWQNGLISLFELQLRPEVFFDERVQHAIELQQLGQCRSSRETESRDINFFTRFFDLIASPRTPFLMACLIHQEFWVIRKAALKSMHMSSHHSYYPVRVQDLVRMLGYDDEAEVEKMLEVYGINVVDGKQGREAVVGKVRLEIGRMAAPQFSDVKDAKRSADLRIVQSKAIGIDLVDIIDGIDIGLAKPVPAPHGSSPAEETSLQDIRAFDVAPLASEIGRKGSVDTKPGSATSAPGSKPLFANGLVNGKKKMLNFVPSVPLTPTPSEFTRQPDAIVPPSAQPASFALQGSSTQLLSGGENANSAMSFSFLNGDSQKGATPSRLLFSGFPVQPSVATPIGFQAPLSFSGPSLLQGQTSSFYFSDGPKNSTNATSSVPFQSTDFISLPQMSVSIPSFQTPSQEQISIITSATTEPPQSIILQPSLKVPAPQTPTSEIISSILNPLIDVERESLVTQFLAEREVACNSAYELIIDDSVITEAMDVADETIRQLLHSSQMGEEWDEKRTLRSALGLWFRNAKGRAIRRQKELEARQEKAVRFYLCAAGLARLGGPTVEFKGSGVKRRIGSNSSVVDSDQQVSRALNKITEAQKLLFKYLDIPAIIFDELVSLHRQRPSGFIRDTQLRWKLVLSTPGAKGDEGDRKANSNNGSKLDHLNRFTSYWTRSKFGAGGDGSGAGRRSRAVGGYSEGVRSSRLDVVEEELLRISVERRDKPVRGIWGATGVKRRLNVIVDHVDIAGDAIYPLRVNCEAICSGISAAIFQFRMHRDGNEKTSWLAEERERLYAFLSTFPLGSYVPLLLIYFPSQSFTEEQFKASIWSSLNLDSILAENCGPVSAIDVVFIDGVVDGPGIAAGDAITALSDRVAWLARQTKVEPLLLCDIITDVIENATSEPFHNVLDIIEECIPRDDFALDIDANVSTFNLMVDLFNLQLDIISSVVSSTSLHTVTYPAREFISSDVSSAYPPLPEIEWNSPKRLRALVELIHGHQLPQMPIPPSSHAPEVSTEEKLRSVRSLYESYCSLAVASLSAAANSISNSATSLLSPSSAFSASSTLSHSSPLVSLWSLITPYERGMAQRGVICGSSGGVGRSSPFPFHKLSRIFTSLAISTLESSLSALNPLPWYLAADVALHVRTFGPRTRDRVAEWEAGIVTPWKEMARVGHIGKANLGEGAVDTETALVPATPTATASLSSERGDEFAALTNIPTATTSSTEVAPACLSTRNRTQKRWSARLMQLKRKLDESISNSRAELEICKRRMADEDLKTGQNNT